MAGRGLICVLNINRCGGGNIVKLPDGVPFGPLSEAGLLQFMDNWDLFFSNPKQSVLSGPDTDTGTTRP